MEMPATPTATAAAEATPSCQLEASANGLATGESHVVSGVQTGANCRKPPTTDSAASAPTVKTIDGGPSAPSWRCGLSAADSAADASPSRPNTMKKRRKV